MNILEYIVLAVITILALVFIVRIIIKTAKGESPCMFCKSCGDDEKSSCKAPLAEDNAKQEDENKNKED